MEKKTVTNKANKQNKNVSTAKKESAVTKVNLSVFTDALKNVQLKEKKDKSYIYNYPDGWTKDVINSEEGKKFRNRQRSILQRFANNIFVFTKTQNIEELQKEIEKFDAHYTKMYRVNDYTLQSISNSRDEKKEKDLKLMLQIIAEYKLQSSKK